MDGQPPINISNDPDVDATPSWSPDGGKIVFTSRRDWPNPIWGIYLVNPDGSDIQLVPLPFFPSRATWKPDGTRLAVQEVATNVEGNDIWSVNPDGTDAINLTNHSGNDVSPSWSP